MKDKLRKVSVLAAMVLTIYASDRLVAYFFKEQTLAPVLAILCFGVLIFLGSPRLILVAIPVFALESYWLIHDLSAYPHIRTASLVLGGLLAFWACLQRQNLEARLAEIDLILTKLDAPWILCDRSGDIRRLSTSAAQLAQANSRDLEGTSFFSKFSAGAAKGELIQKFLQTADSRTPVEKITLSLTPSPLSTPATSALHTLPASFNPIQTPAGPGILVVLSPLPPKPF